MEYKNFREVMEFKVFRQALDVHTWPFRLQDVVLYYSVGLEDQFQVATSTFPGRTFKINVFQIQDKCNFIDPAIAAQFLGALAGKYFMSINEPNNHGHILGEN